MKVDEIIFDEKAPQIDKYWNLFLTNGWNEEYNFSIKELHKSLLNSWYQVSAYKENNLIGSGRVISDGIHHALIVDLIVHPDYQRKGIGSKLLGKNLT